MRRIFDSTARCVYNNGKVQYFYNLEIYEQSYLGACIRRLFRLKKLYRVNFVLVRKSVGNYGYSTDFKRVLCDSYPIGREALSKQVESLRRSGYGSSNDDEKYVEPLIDNAFDYVNLYATD